MLNSTVSFWIQWYLSFDLDIGHRVWTIYSGDFWTSSGSIKEWQKGSLNCHHGSNVHRIAKHAISFNVSDVGFLINVCHFIIKWSDITITAVGYIEYRFRIPLFVTSKTSMTSFQALNLCSSQPSPWYIN